MKIKTMLAGFLLMTGTAWSQTNNITIPNYSFEGISTNISSPSSFAGGTKTGTIGAWNGTATSGVSLGGSVSISSTSTLPASPPDGTFAAKISLPTGLVGVFGTAELNQQLSTSFMPNSIYQLSFYLNPGGTAIGGLGAISISLQNSGSTVTTLSGGSLTGLLNPSSYSLVTLTYTNLANTGAIGIDFNATTAVGTPETLYLDNFKLIQIPIVPNPEPATVALFSLGLATLIYKIRQLRKPAISCKPKRVC